MRKIALAFVLALLVALLVRWKRSGDTVVAAATPAEAIASPAAGVVAAAASPAAAPAASLENETGLVEQVSGGCVCESASGVSLKWMVRHQNLDGSWGGEAESFEGHVYSQTSTTALCLLSLISAGYSHLSRETVSIEGSETAKTFGETIKAGLKWLDARPPTDAFDASLAGLVMSEAFGITESAAIKSFADSALAREDAFQRFDATRGDSLAESWAALAATSARMSDLEFDAAAAERTSLRLKDSLDAAPSPEAAAAYLLFAKDREHPALPGLATSLAAALPDWQKPDFTRWYFGNLALMQIEGPGHADTPGESWKAWSSAVKDVLIRNQERDGTWPGISGATGTAVRTALGTMALEVYYRYSGMIGVK